MAVELLHWMDGGHLIKVHFRDAVGDTDVNLRRHIQEELEERRR